MNLLDLLWNVGQEVEISQLRRQVDQARLENDLARWDHPNLKELASENLELKLRLALLVRLLISKRIITAEEYAALIAEAQPKPESGKAKNVSNRPEATAD